MISASREQLQQQLEYALLMDKITILSIRSEEVLLFLVLFIHINTHNRMEINL